MVKTFAHTFIFLGGILFILTLTLHVPRKQNWNSTLLAFRPSYQSSSHIVIKKQTFGMEGSVFAKEMNFIPEFQNCVNKLNNLESAASSTTQLSSSLLALHQVATEGSNLSIVGACVESLSTRSDPPLLDGLEKYYRSNSSVPVAQILSGCHEPRAMVLVDLSITTGPSLEHSWSLLEEASRVSSSPLNSKVSSSHRDRCKGFKAFSKELQLLCEDFRKEEFLFWTLKKSNKGGSLREILQNPLVPLSHKDFQVQSKYWNGLQAGLGQLVVSQEALVDNQNGRNRYRNVVKVHLALKRLVDLKMTSALAGGKKSSVVPQRTYDYLRSLHHYLRLMASLVSQHSSSNSDAAQMCCLDILEDHPQMWLGLLVLEGCADPLDLEPLTTRLRLHLPLMLVRACCPNIPSGHSLSFQALGEKRQRKFGRVVLNDRRELWKGNIRHPIEAASSLLEQLLSDLENKSEILVGARELAAVDLSVLTTDDHRLAFFINVTLILRIHVNHFLDSYCATGVQVEKLSADFSLGYMLGQLGFVSLRHLRRILVGGHRWQLWGQMGPPCEPRALFFFISSLDQLLVVKPDGIEDQLSEVTVAYLSQSIAIRIREESLEIHLPFLLCHHLDDFLVQGSVALKEGVFKRNCCGVNPLDEWMWSEEIFLSGSKAASLLIFLAENTEGEIQQEIMSVLGTDSIVCKPDLTSPVTSGPVQQCASFPLPHLPSPSVSLVRFLQDRCPIFIPILNILTSYASTDVLPALHQLLLLPSIILWSKVNSERSDADAALGLAYHPKITWQLLQNFLITTEGWEVALELLCSAPDNLVLSDPRLLALKDVLLAKKISKQDSDFEEDSPNWLLCEEISDPVTRAEVVLSHLSHWSGEAAMNSLSSLLCGRKSVLPLALAKRLQEQLHIVRVCQEVAESCSIEGGINWHDVHLQAKEDPVNILNGLVDAKKLQLALQWADLHGITGNERLLVDTSFLIALASQEPPDITRALKHLESLPSEQAVSVCKSVLPRIPCWSIQIPFVGHLVHRCHCHLSLEESSHLRRLELGLHLLSILHLPKWELDLCAPLASQPLLLVEQLLLNLHLDALWSVLEVIRPRFMASADLVDPKCLDFLLENYAGKALEWPTQRVLVKPAEVRLQESLTGEGKGWSELTVEAAEEVLVTVPPAKPPSRKDWLPDWEHPTCMSCQVHFSIFNRRHHCRRCGRVICAACSPHRMMVEGYGDVQVRICRECWEASSAPSSSTSEDFNTRGKEKDSKDKNEDEEDEEKDKKGWWQLSLDESHNEVVRREFNYECAPSVALCLSILRVHGDPLGTAAFLLDQAKTALANLHGAATSHQDADVESLLLASAGTLLRAANLQLARDDQQLPSSSGRESPLVSTSNGNKRQPTTKEALLTLSEELGSRLELARLLARAGKLELFPLAGERSNAPERVLVHLVEGEEWGLALEVAAKTGVDAQGIWAAWGTACLRSRDWRGAREKLGRCLPRTLPASPPPLLAQVIHTLRSLRLPHTHDRAIPSPSSLQAILQGITPSPTPKEEDRIHSECLFYLETFGGNKAVLEFLVECGRMKEAVAWSRKVEPGLAARVMGVEALRKGLGTKMKEEMEAVDPSFGIWQPFLLALCKQLDRLGWLHSLLEIQEMCKDYVRAAFTCARLFLLPPPDSYACLMQRLSWLQKAQDHLKEFLLIAPGLSPSTRTKTSPSSSSEFPLVLTQQQVQQQLRAFELQAKLTRLLSCHQVSWEAQKLGLRNELRSMGVPTLLGNLQERRSVAVLCLLCTQKMEEGFRVSRRIIEEWELNAQEVYELASCLELEKDFSGPECNLSESISWLESLTKCISDQRISDSVAAKVASEASSKGIKGERLDRLLILVKAPEAKLEALLQCGRLKSAYVLAVHKGWAHHVQRILDRSRTLGLSQVTMLCERWLIQRARSNR